MSTKMWDLKRTVQCAAWSMSEHSDLPYNSIEERMKTIKFTAL